MSTHHPQEFRAGAPLAVQVPNFGLLADLAGTWVGSGFNLISRPGNDVNRKFVLQVNATKEVLTFNPVNGQIPDRGSVQGDIEIFTMPYVQMVSDAVSSELLHVESGMWINVPSSTVPSQPASVARLATIPHGNSLLAQGTSRSFPQGPEINPAVPTPFYTATKQLLDSSDFPPPFVPPATVTGPLPPGFDITNPNTALTTAIKGQNITNIVVLDISTTGSTGGILNIPFVETNANTVRLDAIFWIETVTPPDGAQPFLQLQYTQTVILNFLDISWPHISVATLVKN